MTVEKKTSKPKKTATTKKAKKTVEKTAESAEVLAPLNPPSFPSAPPAADKKKPSKLVLPSRKKAPVVKNPGRKVVEPLSRQANRRRG